MSDQFIFANWFRNVLSDKRLTASEVAERARISKASCYFYLSGTRLPDPDSVAKLCAALRVDPSAVPAFQRRLVGKPAHRSHVNVR
jgi:transcriptional regulator with XRE-family HTH domain